MNTVKTILGFIYVVIGMTFLLVLLKVLIFGRGGGWPLLLTLSVASIPIYLGICAWIEHIRGPGPRRH